LAAWLQEKIAEQRRVDASYGPGAHPPVATTKKDDNDPTTAGVEADIRLVIPDSLTSRGGGKHNKDPKIRKHRHGTKNVYYDKAGAFAQSVQSTLPVIGVDLPSELINSLAFDLHWIHDDDAWRTVMHSVPGGERKYTNAVREAVQVHCKSPGGNVWLFNVRDARGFLLQIAIAK
jgi:translation initiation factor 2-alpha kinase 4